MGQLLSAYETHKISSTHYYHSSAPPSIRSDGFLWNTTSCCCNARSSSTCCCNTRCCNTLYRAKIMPVLAVIFWRRLPTRQQQQQQQFPSAGERRCNFRSEDVPFLGLIHEVPPEVLSAGRTRARTSCCLRRRDGKECRLYTHKGTKAFIRHLRKASYYIIHPRRFARNASYERSSFWRITTQAHPKES